MKVVLEVHQLPLLQQKTDSCVEQGLVSMTGTFIDTVVICTMTGIAILLTNSHTSGLEGAAMTTQAFE